MAMPNRQERATERPRVFVQAARAKEREERLEQKRYAQECLDERRREEAKIRLREEAKMAAKEEAQKIQALVGKVVNVLGEAVVENLLGESGGDFLAILGKVKPAVKILLVSMSDNREVNQKIEK